MKEDLNEVTKGKRYHIFQKYLKPVVVLHSTEGDKSGFAGTAKQHQDTHLEI